ncbi:hypothetical protein LJN55_02975 [Erwinia rhapontici]|uniref:hypothetical protein n=1 Tax=Erwinia rhapontici TaxID=55212 RepID=UPI001D0D99FB|nr:hypothetical protein [Erwinia rhapontici]UDQ80838.1 hypothetical protein LJN55_02975 [Erwinia rhapontici]
MKCWLFILILSAFSCGAITPAEIQHGIQKDDKHAFARKTSDGDWRETLNNISAGKGEWIALAPELAPVMDRQHAIQLGKALYNALLPNAKETLAVLAILDQHQHAYPFQQGTGTSCLPPLNKAGDAVENQSVYEQTRLALLDVGPQGADCLWTMEALVEEVKSVSKIRDAAR